MNNTIRDYLINIYDKLSHKATLLNGIQLFKYLIKKEFYVNDKCNYIIKELTEQTNKLIGEDKKECLILLPYFFLNQISLKYLTKILYILFNQINHTTEIIFVPMSKIFADILKNVQAIDNQSSASENNFEENNKYENILLQFCLDLIDNNNLECIFKSKYHDFSLSNYQQKCGFLFLSQFIEHYNNLVNDNRILNIIITVLKTHFCFLKNKNYIPKIELLICINNLINKLKQNFSIYAKNLLNNIYTFDKTLSYSSSHNKNKSNDFIELKKYLLEIIYSLLLFNKKELIDDYNKLLTYAKINKSDHNKEIRTISIKIIDIIIKENNTIELNINNYISNDLNNNKKFSKTINYKERALSFKNKESQIKKMINEDKKKYGDKKKNKNFIFVSQKKTYEPDNRDTHQNYFIDDKKENNKNFKKNNYEKKDKNKYNNLNVVNIKMNEIKNMNDTMIKTVNNIENYLNNNFYFMEIKLNKIDKYEEENDRNKNINTFSKRNYYSVDKNINNLLDEKVKNIILDDKKLIDFLEDISEEEINNISSQYYEQILNRLMILNLINKNKPSQAKKYSGLIQKLLDSKKINIKNDYNDYGRNKNNYFQKYKISHNLENNLDYLFNSLNN